MLRLVRLPFRVIRKALEALRDGGRDAPAPDPRAWDPPGPAPESPPSPPAAEPPASDAGTASEGAGTPPGEAGADQAGGDGGSTPTIRFESTPNPDAMKFVVGVPVVPDGGSLSFPDAASAADHPLGRALFAIPGVRSVFAVADFVTITRQPGVSWGTLTHPVTEVLEEHFRR